MDIQNYFPSGDIELEDLGNGVSRKITAWHDNLMCVEIHFAEGAVGKPHSHPHEQINYIIKGKFEIDIDGQKKVLGVGDSTYQQPDVVHGCVCLEEGIMLNLFVPCRADFL